MKRIVNICLKNGWLLRDPFLSYRMSKKEVVREILTEEEIQVVLRKSFPTDRLNNVRDIFIFSCFTGLAYADIKKLKAVDIIKGIDGSKWISTQRQNTKTISKIPLLSTALDILNKYRDHPRCISKHRAANTKQPKAKCILKRNRRSLRHTKRINFSLRPSHICNDCYLNQRSAY